MTGSSICAEARPVRKPDSSVLSTALAPCMRRLISFKSCVAFVIAIPPTCLLHLKAASKNPHFASAVMLTDDGRASLAAQHRFYRGFFRDRKHDDRYTIFAGKRESGPVHHPEILFEGLLVAQLFVSLCLGVFLGVGGINAVDIGRLE